MRMDAGSMTHESTGTCTFAHAYLCWHMLTFSLLSFRHTDRCSLMSRPLSLTYTPCQYDWTTGVPDNGNGWGKFRTVPRSHPFSSLVLCFCSIGVETQGLKDYQGRAGIISIDRCYAVSIHTHIRTCQAELRERGPIYSRAGSVQSSQS